MRYMGGKTWLAKPIVRTITHHIGGEPVWEPFCGGLSVTVQLARTRDVVLASDNHAALIHLCKAMQRGWDPPSSVTKEEFEQAKLLPDEDPRKGFIGFGTSFGGQWFYGLAKSNNGYDYAAGSRKILKAQFRSLKKVEFRCESFFDVEPGSWKGHLYCDPPYQGTKTYTTGRFDHELFWERCQQWADSGSRVFVSEFTCPIPHVVRWSVERNWSITRFRDPKSRVDTLFEVVPSNRTLPSGDIFDDLDLMTLAQMESEA
jgi:DNA adenine methylase